MAVTNLRGISPASAVAGGTIPQYAPVKIGANDGEVVVVAAVTDICIGIAMQSAVAGQTVPIQQLGRAKVKASGSISRGDRLMWASGNKVATLSGTTAKIYGEALLAAADGDMVEFEAFFPSLHDTQ